MTVVVIVLVVLVALALARLTYRTVWSERRSIDHHEHAMGVLRDLSSRAGAEDAARLRGAARDAKTHVYPEKGPRRAAPASSRAVPSSGARPSRGRVAPDRQGPDGEPSRRGAAGAEERPGRREAVTKPAMVFISDDLAVEAPPADRPGPGTGASAGAVRAGGAAKAPPPEPAGAAKAPPPEPAGAAKAPPPEPAGAPPREPPPPPSPAGGPEGKPGSIIGLSAANRALSAVKALGGPRTYRPRFGVAVGLAAVVMAAAALAGVLVSTRPFSTGVTQQTPRKVAPSHSAPATPPALSPASSDSSGAQYQVSSQAFTVVVAATSGPCWTEVKATAGSNVQSEGTLQQGQAQTLPASGTLWLRLGNAPNVSLTLNGRPVQLPQASASSPYDLTFTSA